MKPVIGSTIREVEVLEHIEDARSVYRVRCACGVRFRVPVESLTTRSGREPLRHDKLCEGRPCSADSFAPSQHAGSHPRGAEAGHAVAGAQAPEVNTAQSGSGEEV